jgi:hypothetical protein
METLVQEEILASRIERTRVNFFARKKDKKEDQAFGFWLQELLRIQIQCFDFCKKKKLRSEQQVGLCTHAVATAGA